MVVDCYEIFLVSQYASEKSWHGFDRTKNHIKIGLNEKAERQTNIAKVLFDLQMKTVIMNMLSYQYSYFHYVEL